MVSLVLAGRRNLGRRSLARLDRIENGNGEPPLEILAVADPSTPTAQIKRAISQLEELAKVDSKTAGVLITAIDSNFVLTMKNKKTK